MKVIDGFWLTKKGYEIRYASQAYEVATTENSIIVLATPEVINHRGQTLAGPNLEIVFSSTAKDIIKVNVNHFRGGLDNCPKFELDEDQGYTPIIATEDGKVVLTSGNTRVEVKTGKEWEVTYYYHDKKLTGNGWRSTSYVLESPYKAEAKRALQADEETFQYPIGKDLAYIREQLTLSVGEYIYGFGEKFTPFVKNGQVVEMWNSDGGTCTEASYKSVPFYLSSAGYGVFVNSTDRVSYEVASETVSKVAFTVPGEEMEYFVIGGNDLHEVLSNYTLLTGRPALPPAYSFGLWLSTSFTTNYNEETVVSFIDGMKERDIPLQVFHFDCFWMKEYEWCNMQWDTRQFPDPEGMLKRLKEKGLEICVWINPYVGQRSYLFDIGKEKGYFLKNKDGSVYQSDLWQPGMAIVDFTNPEACEWYTGLLKTLFEMGVNNIKTDFGERIPTDVVYYNGKDPVKMHNYYTYIYNKTIFGALEDFYGKDQACLFSRSATAGGQKFPVHWGGDCFADYTAMAETLRGGLSLCASGFGFFSHDIGGFEATATPDLYKRWCAFGLLSSHSRLHGSSTYRVPWLFDDEACDVLRFYTKLKGSLMPYIFAQAIKTHETGVPMMRAMIIDFMEDAACRFLDTQYMLGDSLLVAPIMNPAGVAEFYLPNGIWTDIVTGDVYEGGRYVKRTCSYTEMPILAKENSILGFGKFEQDTVVYDYVQDTEFVIYQLADGKTAEFTVYDAKANEVLKLAARRNGNTIEVDVTPTEKEYEIKVFGNDTKVKAGNGVNHVEISVK